MYVVAVGSFFYVRHVVVTEAQALFLPFEGRITNVDYISCSCMLSLHLTITESVVADGTARTYTLIFPYGFQILEDFLGIQLPFPEPRVFPFYQIFYAGPQKTLGNYFPYAGTCWQYVPPFSCSSASVFEGIIFYVGTSLY
jgi:hypothetical protein